MIDRLIASTFGGACLGAGLSDAWWGVLLGSAFGFAVAATNIRRDRVRQRRVTDLAK